MHNSNLYGWLFTFNPYTQLWYAAPRDLYFELFNNQTNPGILSHASFDQLRQRVLDFAPTYEPNPELPKR